MRVAHFADCHLSYRAHQRTTGGVNTRERDVALAFRSVVDGIIVAKPDVVVCGGDLFDSPRPCNEAIVFAFRQFKRIREALPDVPIVIAAGNHETQRKSETGSIFGLFDELGVEVALMNVRQLAYPHLDLRITAVPHTALMAGDPWGPTGTERHQILVLHGEIEGVYSKFGDRPAGLVTVESVTDPAWSYAALGDWHSHKPIGPRAFYAGSTEFVSSNIWSEIGTPKSWLLVDLDTGEVQPQLIPSARAVLDLEPLDATGLTPEQVDAAIAERIGAQDIGGAIVRLIITDIPVAVSRELDHKLIHAAKASALHLHLDLRRPEIVHSAAAAEFLAMRRQPFGEMYTDYMARRVLTPGLDRAGFLSLAQTVLDEATEAEAAKLAGRGAAA